MSGVALANQTKERAKTESSWISPILWILVFFLGKTSAIHIELWFRCAPGKSSWTGLSLVWFAGVTPEHGNPKRKWGQRIHANVEGATKQKLLRVESEAWGWFTGIWSTSSSQTTKPGPSAHCQAESRQGISVLVRQVFIRFLGLQLGGRFGYFLFFLLRGGKVESGATGKGGGGYWKSQEGGGVSRGRGEGAGSVSAGNLGGGGLRGRNAHQDKVRLKSGPKSLEIICFRGCRAYLDRA